MKQTFGMNPWGKACVSSESLMCAHAVRVCDSPSGPDLYLHSPAFLAPYRLRKFSTLKLVCALKNS